MSHRTVPCGSAGSCSSRRSQLLLSRVHLVIHRAFVYLFLFRLLDLNLESLVVPDYNAAEQAGKLILDLPKLWASATLREQRKILLTMLEAIYVDAKAGKRVIAVMPKPPFRPIFQIASAKKDSKIHIINEPLGPSPKGSAVFLVETGESRTTPETRSILDWISTEMTEGLMKPLCC